MAEAGKGVAEELLIDLDMKPAELERFKFQSRTQNPENVGYLENLGEDAEELLIDLEPAELERFRFQSRTQTPDNVGYLENLEEDAVIPVTCDVHAAGCISP